LDKLIVYVTLDSRVVQKKDLDKKNITIGREKDNDIHINNLAVSRHHAEISNDGGKFFIRDLKSANGVFLNGSRIEYAEINAGDVLIIGKYALRIENTPKADDMAFGGDSTVVVDQATQDKFLKKLDHAGSHNLHGKDVSRLLVSKQGEVTINNDYFTIGNDTGADLIIDGWLVKERHATIVKRKDGKHSIISSGSFFCPTRVNGSRIDETTLTTGDVIQIGSNKMIYVS